MTLSKIAVLAAAHNRVETTVAGLSRFSALTDLLQDDFEFHFFLLDDHSTDGTGQRVRELAIDITIVDGTGSLYWNRGMIAAYEAARASGTDFDAYLLYNDDVMLDEGFVEFMREFRSIGRAILVGAFRDPATGDISYSGYLRTHRLRPFGLRRTELDAQLVPVDAFNGNLVVVPADVFRALGGLDPGFWHGYGDIDLGLRAKAMGVSSYVFGVPIGSCERGPSWLDQIRAVDRRRRWKMLYAGIHGLDQHARFVRRHGVGTLLPAYVAYEALRRSVVLFPRRKPLPEANQEAVQR